MSALASFSTRPRPARSPRVPFVRTVQVRPLGSVLQPRRLCVSDLSRGGLFIRTPDPFPAGTRLTISLEVRGRVLPFAEVEVAWHRQRREALSHGGFPGFGARFTHLAPRAQALVDHLVFLCSPPRPPPAGPRKHYAVPPGLKPRRGSSQN